MGAWLDAYFADQILTVEARWLMADGDSFDAVAFHAEVEQLREAFMRTRAECLATVTRAFDELRRTVED
jgi:hypothetical protein